MFTFKYNTKEEGFLGLTKLHSKMNVITSIVRANLSTGMWDTNPHACEKFTVNLIGSMDSFLLAEEGDDIEDIVQRVKWFLDRQAEHFFGWYRGAPIEVGVRAFVGICEAFGLVGQAYALCNAWYSEVDITPDDEYERCQEEGVPYYPDMDYRYCDLYSAMFYRIDGFSFPSMQEVIENLYTLMKRGPNDPLF